MSNGVWLGGIQNNLCLSDAQQQDIPAITKLAKKFEDFQNSQCRGEFEQQTSITMGDVKDLLAEIATLLLQKKQALFSLPYARVTQPELMDDPDAPSDEADLRLEEEIETIGRHTGVECAACDALIENEEDGESTPHGSMHKGCAEEHEREHPDEW